MNRRRHPCWLLRFERTLVTMGILISAFVLWNVIRFVEPITAFFGFIGTLLVVSLALDLLEKRKERP